jgi:hypothetical protein
VYGEVLEAAKSEEIELNYGKLVAPVTRNVARLAATVLVNPPLPKEGTPFMIPLPNIPPKPPLFLPGYAIGDESAMTNPEPQDVTTPYALKLTTSYTDPASGR